MTRKFKKLSHSIYECKYHIVFCYPQLRKRYWGQHLWSRGYCVSTVGLDEECIRKYVKWQNQKDKDDEVEQRSLFD